MFSSVLNDPSTHDVVFKTSDGGSVSAHRVIVAAGSPVFHAMLYGNMKESSQNEIDLPTVDATTLKMVFFFIYTGQVQTNIERCCYLLQAAHYFAIDELIKLSSSSIGNALDANNVFTVTEFAVEHKFALLLQQCLKFIEANAKALVFAVGFSSLHLTVMLAVTKSSKLKVGELDLFLAVVKWSKQQQDKLSEDDIKSVFKQIRYPLIWKNDLLDNVFPTGLADPDLYKVALKYRDSGQYDGPQEQLHLRDYSFDFYPDDSREIRVEDTSMGTLVTKVTQSGESSFAESPLFIPQDDPTVFKIYIKQCRNKARVMFEVAHFMANQPFARMNASEFPIGEEVDGTIFIQNHQSLCAKIGSKSISIPILDENALFFNVRLYYKDDQVLLYKK